MKQYKTTEKQRVAVMEHYRKNRDAKLAYAREYRQKHTAELKAYRDKHRVKMLAVHKAYYHANREKAAERIKLFHEANPDYRRTYNAEFYRRNRTRERKRIMAWQKQQYETNPLYRLHKNLCSRIHQALKRHRLRKTVRSFEITGCSIEFLAGWLESRFQNGMSWDNQGRGGWHIDHVIPCSAFDLSDPKQLAQCFNYSNLQPLWEEDNLRKAAQIFAGDGANPKKIPRSADKQATRESNLNSAAIKPNINKP
jgi:hypothetical protein